MTGQKLVSGIQPVSDANVEDIENNYPNDRFVLTTNTSFAENWNFLFRANYYGSHWDEQGSRDGDFGSITAKIDSIVYVDLELGWDITENWNVTLGGANVFDEYVDKIKGPKYANRLGVGLEYPRRTAAGYDGGSWYLRTSYNF